MSEVKDAVIEVTEVVEVTEGEKPKTRVTARQQELSEKIEAVIKYDENGSFKADKTFVEEILGTDAVAAHKHAQSEASDFLIALGLATGRSGISHLKDNKEVDVISVTIPFVNDVLVASQQRRAEVGLGMGSDEKKVVHGRLTVGYKKKLSPATIKEVRTNISAMAAEILGE